MDEAVYLLEPVLGAERLDKKFSLLLEACEEQQAFALKPLNKIQEVIATINRRLNTSATRRAGLLLLKTFLPQCSDDVFQENAVQWMGQCLREAQNAHSEETAYEVLRMMIHMSSNFPELTKPLSAVTPKIIEQILKTGNKIVVLQCLEVVLRHYGGPCKTNKNALQKFILSFIQEEDPTVVLWASRCASYLPLVGGGGAGATKHRSSWSQQLHQICTSVNKTMDELYANVTELHLTPVLAQLENETGVPLPTLGEESPVISAHHHATVLCNLLRFVESMLSGELPMAKEVRPGVLMALACRGLAVNCTTLGKGASIERVALVSVLPRIHTALLSMLRTLVCSCGRSLIRFGPLICKLVLQTLKWTAAPAWSFGTERPYRHLREAACALLEAWLLRAQGAACVELLADHLVAQLLTDIAHTRTAVTLQVHTKKHLTKQQRREQARQPQPGPAGAPPDEPSASGAPAQGASRVRLADSCANAGPCKAALGALCCLLQAAGPLLKPTLHRQMQEAVLSLLLELQHSGSYEDMPAPYSVPSCRLQLYRLLLQLTLHPNSQWPPPTQFALTIFSAGQHDYALEVAGFCSGALSSVHQIVHPSRSSAQFPVPLATMRRAARVPYSNQLPGPSSQSPLNTAINRQRKSEGETTHEESNHQMTNKKQRLDSSIENGVLDTSGSQDSIPSSQDSVEDQPKENSEGKKKKRRKRKQKEQSHNSSHTEDKLKETEVNDKSCKLSQESTSTENAVDHKAPKVLVLNLEDEEQQDEEEIVPATSRDVGKLSEDEDVSTASLSSEVGNTPVVVLESSNDSFSVRKSSVNIIEVDLPSSSSESGCPSNVPKDLFQTVEIIDDEEEPTVDLADSESSFTLRLEEDNSCEIEEIPSFDGASPKSTSGDSEQAAKEPGDAATGSTGAVSTLTRGSDREMEDCPVGMDAVGEGETVALERAKPPVDGEPAAKKARVEEEDSDTKERDTTDEEDILNSFVDVIAPNSTGEA